MLVEITMIEFRDARDGTRYRKSDDYSWQRKFAGHTEWSTLVSEDVPQKILTVAAEIRSAYNVT